jgi:hypothetical protein
LYIFDYLFDNRKHIIYNHSAYILKHLKIGGLQMTALLPIGEILSSLYLGVVYGYIILPCGLRKLGPKPDFKTLIATIAKALFILFILIMLYKYLSGSQIDISQLGIIIMFFLIATTCSYLVTPCFSAKEYQMIDMFLKIILLLVSMLIIYTPIYYYL